MKLGSKSKKYLGPMGLGQYNGLEEYCGLCRLPPDSSVLLIILFLENIKQEIVRSASYTSYLSMLKLRYIYVSVCVYLTCVDIYVSQQEY